MQNFNYNPYGTYGYQPNYNQYQQQPTYQAPQPAQMNLYAFVDGIEGAFASLY